MILCDTSLGKVSYGIGDTFPTFVALLVVFDSHHDLDNQEMGTTFVQ